MTDFRRRTTFVTGLIAVLLLVTSTLAEDSSLLRAQRLLKSKLTLVFLFEEDMPELAEKGQGLLQFESEVRGVLDASPGAPGILDILYDFQLRWGRLLLSRGDVEGALGHFQVILEAGETAVGFVAAAQATAEVFESQADEFLKARDDASALARYARAEDLYHRAGNEDRALEIGRKTTAIAAREGLKAYAAGDYGPAFETLSTLAAKEPPGFAGSEADQALAWMRENTGVLTVNTLQVPDQVLGQAVTGLRITLKPVRGGRDKTRTYVERFRWVAGEYSFSLLGPDGKPVLSLPVTLSPSGAAVAIPSKLPDGMAFIPAGGKVSRPFFIDKTEVTVGDYRRQFPGKSFQPDQANLPAHGISYDEARQYAAKVGKKLPSYDQWLRAAFGDTTFKYPWGSDDSLQRHCNVGTPGPRPVGYFKEVNVYGLVDVAGNVWEWLDDQHAIGGGFGKRWLISPYAPPGWSRKIDYLRDKRPDVRLFRAFKDPDQAEKYDKYHIKTEMLGEVGIRCVLEF